MAEFINCYYLRVWLKEKYIGQCCTQIWSYMKNFEVEVRLQTYLNPQVEIEIWTLLKIHQNARTLNLFSYIETDLIELQNFCQNNSTFLSKQTISTNRSAITKCRKLKIVVERFKKEIFLFKWVQIWDLGMDQAQTNCC